MNMKEFFIKLKQLLLLTGVAAAWAVPANAVIDESNPSWLMYRNPFGLDATQGETFRLDVVMNRDQPAGYLAQVRGYNRGMPPRSSSAFEQTSMFS